MRGVICHSLRGSVDWNGLTIKDDHKGPVTPYAGVWIEIAGSYMFSLSDNVTPYAGVWIEINEYQHDDNLRLCHSLRGSVDWNSVRVGFQWHPQRVTPYAGVWIEIYITRFRAMLNWSLPTRECGLKFVFQACALADSGSLPTRECGLKLSNDAFFIHCGLSLPTRECGLKLSM